MTLANSLGTGIGAAAAPTAALAASLSIVVPTYRERDNLPGLIRRIDQVRREQQWDVELLIMDDDSGDGSAQLVAELGLPWVRLVSRHQDRGLSPAVLEGLRLATKDTLLVMDADLSHPPEAIPAILEALDRGADFVVGSRYVPGGCTDDDWGLFRWLNSRLAALLARPLTSIHDPMSGFFALRRQTFLSGSRFNPIGYKIGLELMLKCPCQRVREVPIHFANRQLGQSKLCLKEQLRYLQHLRRLYIHKYGTWSHLAQFAVVGFSGLIVNLLLLTVLLAVGVPLSAAVAGAILLSMLWNFALNRRFSFSYARRQSLWPQLAGFMAACSLGAAVNYLTTLAVVAALPGRSPQLAATLGVLAGLTFNFLASRYAVFRSPGCPPRP